MRLLTNSVRIAMVMALAACTSAPAAQKPTVVPAATAAPAANPTEAAKPAASAAWEAEWNQVVAAAKREGMLTVIGPTGDDRREYLTEPFQRQYGISVEYWSPRGSEIPPRVTTERQGGQYLWDVFVGGTTTFLTSLGPSGFMDAMEPALILPEVKDPSKWRGGGVEFVDDKRQLAALTTSQRSLIMVNPANVDPKSLKSYRDLLDPKWKGKLVMDDPLISGSGQATFIFFYLEPSLGPNFIRELARQEPVRVRDFRQGLDFVAQGRYPIGVGLADSIAEPLIKQGLPLVLVDPLQLAEGTDMSPVTGSVALFNRPAHPNAAKVYLNWLLSQEGQTGFARMMGLVSNRTDVPTSHAAPWRLPQPNAIRTYTIEGKIVGDEKVAPLLKEVFGEP